MEIIVILLAVLFIISAYCAVRGIIKRNIKYGYKYYGKGVSSNRKDDPINFWFGITLYGTIAIGSLVILIYYVGKIV